MMNGLRLHRTAPPTLSPDGTATREQAVIMATPFLLRTFAEETNARNGSECVDPVILQPDSMTIRLRYGL